jgi:hypothetical protein
MIEFLDKDVTIQKLNREIVALGIPGFIGMARMARRKDETGVWKDSERYLLVKFSDSIDPRLAADLLTVIDAHVADRPTVVLDWKEEYKIATTDAVRLAILAKHLGVQ